MAKKNTGKEVVTATAIRPEMIIPALALVALALSGYLVWHSWHGQTALAGCGEGADCDEVLQSRWGSWFGLPVSAGGVVIYGGILAVSMWIRKSASSRLWLLLLFLAVLASASALWFVGLQVFLIHSYCKYCLAIHACGIVLTILILRCFPWQSEEAGKSKRKEERIPVSQGLRIALSALIGVVVLAAGQLYTGNPSQEIPPATPSPATSPSTQQSVTQSTVSTPAGRDVLLAKGKLRLTIGEFPIYGSPDADMVVAEFFDYTCPVCRQLHPGLMSEFQPFANRVALVLIPEPLDAECNPSVNETAYTHRDACTFARIGLALWRISPRSYATYEAFVFRDKYPPTAEAALELAYQLAGKEAVDRALSDPQVGQLLRTGLEMFFFSSAIERKSLPTLATREEVFTGFPTPGLLTQMFSGQK